MQKKAVLIIEDEIELNEILMWEFQDLNYIVFTAQNLNEALKILKENHVDFVLSDINMPGGAGTELMKYLSSFINPNVPVVFMTGASVTENEVKNMGATGLVRKPFSLDSITQLAKNLIH